MIAGLPRTTVNCCELLPPGYHRITSIVMVSLEAMPCAPICTEALRGLLVPGNTNWPLEFGLNGPGNSATSQSN